MSCHANRSFPKKLIIKTLPQIFYGAANDFLLNKSTVWELKAHSLRRVTLLSFSPPALFPVDHIGHYQPNAAKDEELRSSQPLPYWPRDPANRQPIIRCPRRSPSASWQRSNRCRRPPVCRSAVCGAAWRCWSAYSPLRVYCDLAVIRLVCRRNGATGRHTVC